MDMPTTETKPTTDAGTLRSGADRERRRTRERRRKIGRTVRQTLLGLLVLGAVAGTVYALRPRPVPVDVAKIVRGPLTVSIEESGTTRVKDRYVVSAPVTGRLSRLALEPGDAVKEGDPLAEIAPASSPLLDERTRAEAEGRLGAALAALGQARAQASRAVAADELAQKELLRTRSLAASGSISPQALEQAEFLARMRTEERSSAVFASKVAEEEVRIARMTLGRGQGGASDRHVDVLSPVTGRVLQVHQKSAGVVQAGTPILEVGDPEALEVIVDLLTTDAIHVQSGTPVEIERWGGERMLSGRVVRIEPSAFTKPSALGVDEQRVNAIIALTDPRERWAALGDAYRVEARFVLWKSDDVLAAPQGALFRRGEGWAVFRIDRGVARLTPVEIGHRGETRAEILSGLSEGMTVAVHPGDRVKDGVRVEPR